MIAETVAVFGVFLGDIAKAVATDKIKEWLKTDHARRGKLDAFDLYQSLERLPLILGEFIKSLNALAEYVENKKEIVGGSETMARMADLHSSFKAVLEQIRIIEFDRADLGMPLEIHKPELIRTITQVGLDRSRPLPVGDPLDMLFDTDLYRKQFGEFVAQTGSELRDRAKAASVSAVQIQKAAEEYRKFLAAQFPFKESF
jgi:hypothetical protein